MQSLNFEIRYKKAEEMIVTDALLKAHTQQYPSVSSPGEKDPCFPYVPENTGYIYNFTLGRHTSLIHFL